MNKAKVGLVGSGILYWSSKRRAKAMKGQKLLINNLNNNHIIVNGNTDSTYIEKDDIIKVEYDENNEPIELEAENNKFKIFISSSFTAKIKGIGKRVPKIIFSSDDHIIAKIISDEYQFEVESDVNSSVKIKSKYKNFEEETFFYSDINLTEKGLLQSKQEELEYILIPYENLTAQLWEFFLIEITKFLFSNNIRQVKLYKHELNNSNLITFMLHRYHFEVIHKFFLKTLSDNIYKIIDQELIVSIIGGNPQFESFDRENILSVISNHLSQFTSNFGNYYNYYNAKIEDDMVIHFKEFVIALVIANGFLKISQENENKYIDTLRNIQKENSISDNLLSCIRNALNKFKFFENSEYPSY